MESPATQQQHLLFVTNPMQGHINPARRLATRVLASCPRTHVTFSTAIAGHRRMFPSLPSPDAEVVDDAGVLHVPYSDGYDEGYNPAVHGVGTYKARAREAGLETLSSILARLAARGRPVTRVVYTFLVGWVPEVAHAHGVPAALYWIQPAAVFAVYYHYFHGHDAALTKCALGDPSSGETVSLPGGMPPLGPDAMPSVVAITSPDHRHYMMLAMLRDLFALLDEHRPSKVLVNSFDALELDALGAVPRFDLAAVGPVVPKPDDDGANWSLVPRTDDDDAKKKAYMEWLDAKPARSVVYVSFGSFLSMSARQAEEMRRGLEATGRPYLWVMRDNKAAAAADEAESDNGVGMVVGWCQWRN